MTKSAREVIVRKMTEEEERAILRSLEQASGVTYPPELLPGPDEDVETVEVIIQPESSQ